MEHPATSPVVSYFPKGETEKDLPTPAVRRDLGLFERGIRVILASHGLDRAALSVLPGGGGGSMPLFTVNDDLVIKLFPAIVQTNHATEVAALRELRGKTSFGVPQLRFYGTLDRWHYIIMTRIGGVQLATIWKSLDLARKEIVCERLGAVVAELHRIGTPAENAAAEWKDFLDRQARGCVERQRTHGLRAELLAQIPGYIEPVLASLQRAPLVFLHTELMPEHVFVDPERLTIDSLIDFEPSMTGAAEYDFGAVAIFIAEGQPTLLRAFLRGYGYSWNNSGQSTARVMLVYKLLHRYSRLTWYLDRLEGERGRDITDLRELEKKWCSI